MADTVAAETTIPEEGRVLTESEKNQRFGAFLTGPEEATPEEEAPATDDEIEAEAEVEATGEEVEAEAEEQAEPEAEDVDLYTVRVRGEEIQVTMDELLAGHSRHADYTRDKQAIAEERKSVEVIKAEAMQLQAQYAAVLPQIQEFLAQPIGAAPTREQFQDDTSFLLAQSQYQMKLGELQTVQNERDRVLAEQQAFHQQQQAEWVATQHASILERVPAWKDTDVAKTDMQAMEAYALGLGFTPEELKTSTFADARVLEALHAATRGASARKQGAKVRKAKTKAVEPGTGTDSVQLAERQRNELKARAKGGDTLAADRLMGELIMGGQGG